MNLNDLLALITVIFAVISLLCSVLLFILNKALGENDEDHYIIAVGFVVTKILVILALSVWLFAPNHWIELF